MALSRHCAAVIGANDGDLGRTLEAGFATVPGFDVTEKIVSVGCVESRFVHGGERWHSVKEGMMSKV